MNNTHSTANLCSSISYKKYVKQQSKVQNSLTQSRTNILTIRVSDKLDRMLKNNTQINKIIDLKHFRFNCHPYSRYKFNNRKQASWRQEADKTPLFDALPALAIIAMEWCTIMDIVKTSAQLLIGYNISRIPNHRRSNLKMECRDTVPHKRQPKTHNTSWPKSNTTWHKASGRLSSELLQLRF